MEQIADAPCIGGPLDGRRLHYNAAAEPAETRSAIITSIVERRLGRYDLRWGHKTRADVWVWHPFKAWIEGRRGTAI